MEDITITEYGWFSIIRMNEDCFNDSQVIHLKNPFQSEELNNFLPYYLRAKHSSKTHLKAYYDALKSFSDNNPTNTLDDLLNAYMAFDSNFKMYEEYIIEKYRKRGVEYISQKYSHASHMDLSADEMVNDISKLVNKLEDVTSDEDGETKEESFEKVMDRWERFINNDFSDYTKTLITDLDDLIIGFEKDSYIVVPARPSMGKTALGISFVDSFSRQGKMGAFVSLEMTKEKLLERLAYVRSDCPADMFTSGRDIDPDEWARLQGAVDEIRSDKNIIVEYITNSRLYNVKRKIRKLIRENPNLEYIILDYLQLITKDDPRMGDPEAIGLSSNFLAKLTKEFGVKVIALAQMNRDAGDGEAESLPSMKHIKGSSAIEQDAEFIIIPHRSKKAEKQCSMNGSTDITIFGDSEQQDLNNLQVYLIVEKNRNGRTGLCKARYNARTTKFYSNDETETWKKEDYIK